MLGNFAIYMKDGQGENNRLYAKLYCSLCAALRKTHNVLFTVFVNNEITLVLLSLEDYIGATTQRVFCPKFVTKRFKRQPAYSHRAIDKAAGISAMLGWIYAIDFCTDNVKYAFASGLVEPWIERLLQDTLDDLDADTQRMVEEYAVITRTNSQDFDLIQSKSYELTKQLYKEIAGETDMPQDKMEHHAHLFGLIGKCIAFVDPLFDIEKDAESRSFNPIIARSSAKKTPLSDEYSAFLDQYWEVEHEIGNILATKAGNFHKTLIYAVSQGLENNAIKIKHTVNGFFNDGEMKNETLASRFFGDRY
ncbi:MAG: DUF5685 family protein [Tannerellaceae bacterium]|jgi:hypothetical protein|nr:DUF5685 family protein [Tannerellaceae bacterium]